VASTVKATALVFSARKKANCYDFARTMLDEMEKEGVETELIRLCDYSIKPCQNCDYECLARIDRPASNKEHEKCPMRDDVESIWRKVWLFFI